jgi:hypothetical protein
MNRVDEGSDLMEQERVRATGALDNAQPDADVDLPGLLRVVVTGLWMVLAVLVMVVRLMGGE